MGPSLAGGENLGMDSPRSDWGHLGVRWMQLWWRGVGVYDFAVRAVCAAGPSEYARVVAPVPAILRVECGGRAALSWWRGSWGPSVVTFGAGHGELALASCGVAAASAK